LEYATPVNLDTLEPQQLAQVKKQLDEELEHLTSSFGQLHGAQSKFRECLRCVNSRLEASPGTDECNIPTKLGTEPWIRTKMLVTIGRR
jgi:prefoldin alpha subunit